MEYEIYDYDGLKASIDSICAYLSSRFIATEKIFDCRLIASELMANVLQHSGGGALLKVELQEAFVQISVKAERVYCPPKQEECPDTNAERGRGIYLIDSLSAERIFTTEGEIVVKIAI